MVRVAWVGVPALPQTPWATLRKSRPRSLELLRHCSGRGAGVRTSHRTWAQSLRGIYMINYH